jgi:hypothetical protein
MTLAEQFPDISMLVREKRKLDLKTDAILLLKNIDYSPVSAEQRFYDRAFRIFHYKLLAVIFMLFASLFYLVLNGQGIWKWIIS